MNDLTLNDFSREEVHRRMKERAATIWQLRLTDLETADPLVGLLLDACAFEFENMARTVEATRYRILDRLASTLCPDVIDLPKPAHAILHARPAEARLDLPQTAQLFYQAGVATVAEEGRNLPSQTLFFSPVVATPLVDASVRYLLSEQGLFGLRGRDRLRLEPKQTQIEPTDYQSVWVGIEVKPEENQKPRFDGLSIYVNWDNQTESNRAAYQRKIQDTSRTEWYLNGQRLPVKAGFQSSQASDYQLAFELDGLHQLEQTVLFVYNTSFVTIGQEPPDAPWDYTLEIHPDNYAFTEQQTQRYFQTPLLWLELRLGGELPPLAIEQIDIRLNCFPVMNRRFNQMSERLRPQLNVFALRSTEEFLFIRRVYDAESISLYRQSPLRDPDQLPAESFMWRSHGVGRFDERDARQIIQYMQQLLRDESRAFSGLGTSAFSQIIDNLEKYAAELQDRMRTNPGDSFRQAHPYIFVRPRPSAFNLFVEFWSTAGELANNVRAGTQLGQYQGLNAYSLRADRDDVFLMTSTTGGSARPDPTAKEHQLRSDLLTRSRLVTVEDIRAECRAYFSSKLGIDVSVEVTKNFAEGLVEGAGYVRCIDVTIHPPKHYRPEIALWNDELERCRQQLESKSAMNLPYRVVNKQSAQ